MSEEDSCKDLLGRLREKAETDVAIKQAAKTEKTNPEKTNFSIPMVDQVSTALLELMRESNSDSVRVAAAKALMDKILKSEEGEDEAKQREHEERARAISEAREFFADVIVTKKMLHDLVVQETASASDGSLSCASAVVPNGEGGATNASG